MSLHDFDELPHRPSGHPRWQENFFVVASATDGETSFLIHCKRWPASGKQVARIAARAGERIVSRKVEERIPTGCLAVGGLQLLPVVPYRQLKLGGRFKGAAGFGPLGFIAWTSNGGIDVEVELTLKSELIPADFTELFAMRAAKFRDDARPIDEEHVQEHYEQGGICEGHLTIEGERYTLTGLFVRDHTWGVRDESYMADGSYGFWSATTLDEGRLFFNALGRNTADGPRGMGVVVDREGQTITTDVSMDFLPATGLYGFTKTCVHIGGDKPIDAIGKAQVHFVKYLPGSGPRRFDDNALSAVEAESLIGFGVHEYAGMLSPEEALELDKFR